MSTVVTRTFTSTPARPADETWRLIVDMLTRSGHQDARDELLAVEGVAASVIAERAAEAAPIVVTCEGPRTRIRCLHDDNAIEGSEANEAPLAHDALAGDWAVSLPCPAEDLDWVRRRLSQSSARVTARDPNEAVDAPIQPATTGNMVIDAAGLLGS